MAETSEKTPTGPTIPDKKRRILLIALITVPILLLFAAAFLLLGSPRRWQVPPRVSPTEAARLQGIIGKLTSAMVTEDGKMAEKAEIELTQNEINTLLTTGLRAAQRHQQPDFYYDAEWSQGALVLRGSKILPVFAVNLEAEIIPSVSADKVYQAVRSCRVGWLALSPKLVETALNNKLKEYENEEEYRAFTAIVESLTVQKKGSVILRLRPDNIKLVFPLLMNAALGRR